MDPLGINMYQLDRWCRADWVLGNVSFCPREKLILQQLPVGYGTHVSFRKLTSPMLAVEMGRVITLGHD